MNHKVRAIARHRTRHLRVATNARGIRSGLRRHGLDAYFVRHLRGGGHPAVHERRKRIGGRLTFCGSSLRMEWERAGEKCEWNETPTQVHGAHLSVRD